MTDERYMPDKSYMFWSSDPKVHYGDKDHTPIPLVTYRCKGVVKRKDTRAWTSHQCKLVTDHKREKCMCICGQEFNPREKSEKR